MANTRCAWITIKRVHYVCVEHGARSQAAILSIVPVSTRYSSPSSLVTEGRMCQVTVWREGGGGVD